MSQAQHIVGVKFHLSTAGIHGLPDDEDDDDPANHAAPPNDDADDDQQSESESESDAGDDLGLDEYFPTYVYHPTGVYEVPESFILRDLTTGDESSELMVSPGEWRAAGKQHHAITAATFLENHKITPQHIVVVGHPEDYDGNHAGCMWFVRISIDGGNTAFVARFGSAFLWQLPTCVIDPIVAGMLKYEKDHSIGDDMGSLLLRTMRSSGADFHPSDWPTFERLDYLENYFDVATVMACAPCAGPLRTARESGFSVRMSFARPAMGKLVEINKCFDDADSNYAIMTMLIDELVVSPHGDDFQRLMQLRLVNKEWRNTIDNSASKHHKRVLDAVRRGLETQKVTHVLEARDLALGSGLPVLAVIQDSAEPITMFHYMRTKAIRRPGSKPPPPK